MWYFCFAVSVIVLLSVAAVSVISSRTAKNNTLPPMNILILGMFFASVIMFIPIYTDSFASDNIIVKWFETIVIAIHHTIRLFIVDSDYSAVKTLIPSENKLFYNIYSCYVATIFVLSPLLTFGVVLSFFKNAAAHRKYLKSYNKNIYVFSELNEKSLALAESITARYDNLKIVFNNVQEQNIDKNIDVSKVKNLKAICFAKDITSVNFNFHSKKRDIKFFMISSDESENTKQGLTLIENYRNRNNTWLYVFSNEIKGELLLNSVDTNVLKLRRISDVRTLIYSLLECSGELLFKEAIDTHHPSNKKLISAVIVGLGKHGIEMTKSLSWFGQMEGFNLEITAFDKSNDAYEKFCALCPELMDEKHNGNFSDNGESQYKITIKNNVDTQTINFYNEIQDLSHITYIFVDVGDDDQNIKTAIELRKLLLKKDQFPRIQAVTKNVDQKNVLEEATNHSGQSYSIDYIGNIQSLYSVETILDSELEAEALSRHLKWGEEKAFWKYEYNYRSSIASALHRRMKKVCNIPGINKTPEERTESERLNLRMMEHRRWNAYMRSEGFTYAQKRNNLAKTHPCLVTFDELSPKEQAKDDD